MAARGASEFVPDTRELGQLESAARSCRGCDLYRYAGQTVFGAGPPQAALMLVGEQPGDREDIAGRPFVGPAGRILDQALAAAEVPRDAVYVTNAVKHFKFSRTAGAKRRIHQTPTRTEVVACRPWLFAELAAVAPEVLILMGATAAKALLGNDFRLTAHRGEVLRIPTGLLTHCPGLDPQVMVTIHPSVVLRGPADRRDESFGGLVADLHTAADLAADLPA